MDEPLSNLDAQLRVSTRAQLAALHDRLRVTTIYVTHDQIEAMTLGTEVAVLKDGQLMQVDAPQDLFDAPANLFVATFIGSPAMNLAEAMLVRDGGGLAVTFADYRLTVPDQAVAAHPGLERFLGRQVILGIRPSSFEDAAFAPPRWPRIKAEAKVTERLGSEVDVIFAVKTPPVQHEVMVAQFDLAAKQPAGEDQEQTGRLVGEGESQWTASVNPHQRPTRPRHRPGRRHLGAVLVRPRQRPSHRPPSRRRPAHQRPERRTARVSTLTAPTALLIATVSRWAKEGKLLFLKTLGGHRPYPEAEIRKLAEGLRERVTT